MATFDQKYEDLDKTDNLSNDYQSLFPKGAEIDTTGNEYEEFVNDLANKPSPSISYNGIQGEYSTSINNVLNEDSEKASYPHSDSDDDDADNIPPPRRRVVARHPVASSYCYAKKNESHKVGIQRNSIVGAKVDTKTKQTIEVDLAYVRFFGWLIVAILLAQLVSGMAQSGAMVYVMYLINDMSGSIHTTLSQTDVALAKATLTVDSTNKLLAQLDPTITTLNTDLIASYPTASSQIKQILTNANNTLTIVNSYVSSRNLTALVAKTERVGDSALDVLDRWTVNPSITFG